MKKHSVMCELKATEKEKKDKLNKKYLRKYGKL